MSENWIGDKRLLSWLNEGAVLLAITKNRNQPTYVAHMVRLAPLITKASDDDSKHDKSKMTLKRRQGSVTKPGMREAARRLCEQGILRRIDIVPPRKKDTTPHYTIDLSIQTLASIFRTYGSLVEGNMRRAGFVGAVIDDGIEEHLAMMFRTSIESVHRLPKADKEELAQLARTSTRALSVFLDPQFELIPTIQGKEDHDLASQLKRLRDVMHLQFIAEVASSQGMKIWEEGWDIDVCIKTVVKSNNASMSLSTTYASNRFLRIPIDVREECPTSGESKRKARKKVSG